MVTTHDVITRVITKSRNDQIHEMTNFTEAVNLGADRRDLPRFLHSQQFCLGKFLNRSAYTVITLLYKLNVKRLPTVPLLVSFGAVTLKPGFHYPS